MRTKVLICAAVLAATVASSLAQNVYSLNVVGYVQVTVPAGKQALVANPLDATMGGTLAGYNNVSNLFSATSMSVIAQGDSVFTFNATLGNYNSPITYAALTKSWGTGGTLALNPGTSILFKNQAASDTVITFVGQVEQGTYAVATIPANKQALLGSPVPIGGDITNSTTAVGLVPTQGDSVFTFNAAGGNYNTPAVWAQLTKKWNPSFNLAPGQGFLYKNASTTTANNWVSNFTVK